MKSLYLPLSLLLTFSIVNFTYSAENTSIAPMTKAEKTIIRRNLHTFVHALVGEVNEKALLELIDFLNQLDEQSKKTTNEKDKIFLDKILERTYNKFSLFGVEKPEHTCFRSETVQPIQLVDAQDLTTSVAVVTAAAANRINAVNANNTESRLNALKEIAKLIKGKIAEKSATLAVDKAKLEQVNSDLSTYKKSIEEATVTQEQLKKQIAELVALSCKLDLTVKEGLNKTVELTKEKVDLEKSIDTNTKNLNSLNKTDDLCTKAEKATQSSCIIL